MNPIVVQGGFMDAFPWWVPGWAIGSALIMAAWFVRWKVWPRVFPPKPFEPIPLTPAEARYERSKKVLDPTKRKSLQPGHTTLPTGYREAHPREIVKDTQMVHRVIEKKIAPPPPQPQVNETATLEELKALEGKSFQHKFFGSQLAVGEHVLVRGLNRGVHQLEITERGQLFIDNLPHTINAGDLARVKLELAKTQQ